MQTVLSKQQRITQFIDKQQARYISISQAIHAKPEIGNEEFFASEQLVTLLKENGFDVQTAVAGHETSFYAVKDSGKPGPTIAYLAEYDALPGLGHACGHNLIGVMSTAAAIALSETLDSTGGKVVVLGTPAEEGGPNGSAKGSFVKHGYLEKIDLALMLHPFGITMPTTDSLAVDPIDFHFYGKSAHAASAPEEGINALDAVIQLYNGINALRQHVAADVRIHGIITNGGDAPNIVPDYASARFYIRANSWNRTAETAKKVEAIAEAAALATGATVKIERFQNEVKDLVVTPAVDAVLSEHLAAVGENFILDSGKSLGSTDAGNISYEVPTAHGYLKIGDEALVPHTPAFCEAANSDYGYGALIRGAKALALTGLDYLEQPTLLAQAKTAHAQALVAKQ
ncbi:MAG TPA: M20 family metallopeptidase [Candidatus Kurthia intestinigallinarum]|nr:M20 family metallopeptidase [Candidatus Kurthia intestinigallinarum]